MRRLSIPRPTVLLLVFAAFACGGEPTASADARPTIDREAFIATYVDLRTEVIRSGGPEITAEARARILSEHGVTEEDLMTFAEVHGTDVAFMKDVWDDVEARLDAVRLVPGTDQRH